MDIISYAQKKTNKKRFFNEPTDEDLAILSLLSYCNFHLIWHNKPIILSKIKKEEIYTITKGIYSDENARLLLEAVKSNIAFKKLKIISLNQDTNLELQKQFYAMTFKINFKNYVICFRGTDGTVVGWKENFALGYLNETPSQQSALLYLNSNIRQHKAKNIYVVGHSKGGNLAEYSALKTKYSKQITRVVNFDGPGNTNNDIYENNRIVSIITKYIPYDSLIGILFNKINYQIVESNNEKLQQHSIYNWIIDNKTYKFSLTNDRSTFSKIIEKTFDSWLSKIPNDSRKEIIDQACNLFKLKIEQKVDDIDIDKSSILLGLLKPSNKKLRDAAIDLLKNYTESKRK